MAVWSYDGYEVCIYRFPESGQGDVMASCPGSTSIVAYYPGQSFYDDALQDSISYQHALQRARHVNADVTYNPQGADESVYGVYLTETAYAEQQRREKASPPQIPDARQDLPKGPTGGTIIGPEPPQNVPPDEVRQVPRLDWYFWEANTNLPPPPAVPDLSGIEEIVGNINDVLNDLASTTYLEVQPKLNEILSAIRNQKLEIPQAIRDQLDRLEGQNRSLIPGVREELGGVLRTLMEAIRGIPRGLTQEQEQQLSGTARLVNDIYSTVNGIGASVASKIETATSRIEGNLNRTIDNVQQKLAAQIAEVGAVVTGVESHIVAALTADTAEIERTVQQSATSIVHQIGADITDLAGGIGTAFGTVGEVIGTSVDSVAAAIRDASINPVDLLPVLYEFFQNVWPSWAEPLKTLVEHAVRGTMDSLEGDAAGLIADVFGQVANAQDAPPALRRLAGELAAPQHAVALLLLIPVLYEVGREIVRVPLEQPLEKWRQTVRAYTPYEIPSLSESAALRSRGLLPATEAQQIAANNGYVARWADLAAEMDRELLTPGQALDLWRRNAIDDATLDAYLRRMGYDDTDIARYHRLAFASPSPQDAVTFLFKDVLNDEIVREWDMDAEFSESYDDALFRRAGVTEQDARYYYRSGWTLPSATEGFQMLHRTADRSTDPDAPTYSDDGLTWTTVIGERTLNRLLKFNDVLPFWRDKLTAISYVPLTRVDIRRMHKLGILSGPEVTRAYMDLGYTLENAKRMRRFTEDLNGQERKNEAEVFRGPVRTRVLTDYVDGTIGERGARTALSIVGYDDDETKQWFAAAGELREAKQRTAIVADVGKLYVDGFWDANQARERLERAGLDPDPIDAHLEDWTLDRELLTDKEDRKHARDLTRADITAGYREGLTARNVALKQLTDAGYDPGEAETILALEDRKTERALASEEIDAVHVQYVRGLIERADALSTLDKLLVSPRSRQSFIRKWDAEKRKPPPHLSDSEIRSLYVAGNIARAGAEAALAARGLAAAEIGSLLTGWDTDRAKRLNNLPDAELKLLLSAGLITNAELTNVLRLRGLSAENVAKLVRAFTE